MFLSKPGVYEPCGMFNYKHLILFILTISLILVAVKYTKANNKEDVRKIIKSLTITIWILEVVKIIYNILTGYGSAINKVVPLYYCSLLLYAGAFSSFGKGFIQRMGDVFLATGGIIGGLVFMACPTTSLPEYPMLHFISLHSFFYHGVMVYLSIIINKYKYIDLQLSDIKYFATLVFFICLGAYIVNINCGSNLMFISKDFPGTVISAVYNFTGSFFTPVMIISQMTLPFLVVYGILNLCKKVKKPLQLRQI